MSKNISKLSESRESQLFDKDWDRIDKSNLQSFSKTDWATLCAQRESYFKTHIPIVAMNILESQKHAPIFGYPTNAYQHCLQAASMALRDKKSDDYIVAVLFHDVFLEVSDENHGNAAAEFLRPYISDDLIWLLKHHGVFINHFCSNHPNVDLDQYLEFSSHKCFDITLEFAETYDQKAICLDYDTIPLEEFSPIVHRVLSQASNKK